MEPLFSDSFRSATVYNTFLTPNSHKLRSNLLYKKKYNSCSIFFVVPIVWCVIIKEIVIHVLQLGMKQIKDSNGVNVIIFWMPHVYTAMDGEASVRQAFDLVLLISP